MCQVTEEQEQVRDKMESFGELSEELKEEQEHTSWRVGRTCVSSNKKNKNKLETR